MLEALLLWLPLACASAWATKVQREKYWRIGWAVLTLILFYKAYSHAF